MSPVPYFSVNLIALCCFVLMFITFAAAKKTPEIRSFLALICAFILWTGGSILMRLQVFPGMNFWYYVSIMALFTLATLFYCFVCDFIHIKGRFLRMALVIGTVLLLAATASGVILAPPHVEHTAIGYIYTYDMKWPVVIPFLFMGSIVVYVGVLLKNTIKEKGVRAPGLAYLIIGSVAIAIGNLLQLLPGNVFPYDTLSGIIFALLMIWALYKKRMFQLSLLISRTAVLVSGAGLCFLIAAYLVEPAQRFLADKFGMGDSAATTVIAAIFAAGLSLMYMLIKKLIDALFIREEQQNRLLKRFTAEVSQSLNTGDVIKKLIDVITSEVPAKCVYVCLPENGEYVAAYSSEVLIKRRFSIAEDGPTVRYLQKSGAYFLISDFKKDPYYLSVWQSEKDIMNRLNLAAVFALRNGEDVVGLILMTGKEKNAAYNYTEINFVETVASIASIAVKNAGLYEQMYREARVDSLTGVYNYRFFVERINKEYSSPLNSSLGLLYVDIDDFKLYNQLHGAVEGDRALGSIADIISLCVGVPERVFRYSGKVFAVILPNYDAREAELLAREISRRVEALNSSPERIGLKSLSVSCGICVSPYAAASAKELIENADLAVYNAKDSGKNRIVVFRANSPVSTRVSERAMAIVEASASHSEAYQQNNSTISALTAAIDAKDHYTYRHSRNVALYSAILATAAGLNEDQISMIYEAALLHDIGKISIPEGILSKTGPLTGDEYSQMKTHVISSIDMIRHLPSMDYVIPAAIGHHERWDGNGYPRGLKHEEIPVSARCLAVADAFDAMTTDRPYRRGLTPEYAAAQIESGAGSQFDPVLSAVFVELVRTGELNTALSASAR